MNASSSTSVYTMQNKPGTFRWTRITMSGSAATAGLLATPGFPVALAMVDDTLAFVAAADAGVQVVSIADPRNPADRALPDPQPWNPGRLDRTR